MKRDSDYVAKRLASKYNLAEPAEKPRLTGCLAVALEVASEPTRDAICKMLGIIYVYPGDGAQPDDDHASV